MGVKVRLETKTGEKVADIVTPPFTPMPDILLWGSRHFTKVTPSEKPLYVEAFAYYVIDDPRKEGI